MNITSHSHLNPLPSPYQTLRPSGPTDPPGIIQKREERFASLHEEIVFNFEQTNGFSLFRFWEVKGEGS